jgi:hypothetical protein
MDLRPQDVVVALKLALPGARGWTYSCLGQELGLSASQVFLSVNRCRSAHLLDAALVSSAPSQRRKDSVLSWSSVNRKNLTEFLVHGVKYAFPVRRGGLTRGLATSYAAPPLNKDIVSSPDPPPVWPSANGKTRGLELSPLYQNVPQAAARDARLYEALALVDAIRDGRAREREMAVRELTCRINGG